MSDFIDIAPEVAEALAVGKPVVALESTIISHGMPYPQNLETAPVAVGTGIFCQEHRHSETVAP